MHALRAEVLLLDVCICDSNIKQKVEDILVKPPALCCALVVATQLILIVTDDGLRTGEGSTGLVFLSPKDRTLCSWLWGVICVKFNGHNVHLNLQHGCIYLNSQNAIMHAQPVKMQAQLVNMHAQHAYCQHTCTTCQHACILSTCMHNMHTVNMHAQHACTTCILSTCMHNMHTVDMHAQHAGCEIVQLSYYYIQQTEKHELHG